MAKNPWALPDGFDNTVKKAISSLMTALKNAKRSIPPEAFDALRMGNWQAFQELMDWHGIEGDFETFKQILQAQAKNAALDFYRTGGVGSQLTFDLIDERAVYWASTRAAELVVEITDQMRLNIRNTITSSTLGDMTWQQAAEEISATLPLTDRDAQAVSKYYNRQVDRLMKKGLTEAKAKAKAATLRDNYALKLTQSRASTIARTEIASAASQGRLLGWEAGIETGMVENDSVKEWIAEPTACEICADMDGKTIPWNEEFPAGVMMPPAHPNCRCSAAILPPDFADSVFTNQAMIKSKGNQFEIEFAKHLAGKHDQTTHGRGGAKDFSQDPKKFFDFIKNPKLSPEQTAAVERYMQGGSPDMNAAAANKGGTAEDKLNNRHLSAAIQSSEGITEEITLYSAVRTAWGSETDKLKGLKVGDVVAKRGFTSTTASQEFAERWLEQGWIPEKGYIFKLTAPKGTKGIAPATAVEGLRAYQNEYEFILDAGQKIEIASIDPVTRVVEAVVLVDS